MLETYICPSFKNLNIDIELSIKTNFQVLRRPAEGAKWEIKKMFLWTYFGLKSWQKCYPYVKWCPRAPFLTKIHQEITWWELKIYIENTVLRRIFKILIPKFLCFKFLYEENTKTKKKRSETKNLSFWSNLTLL